MARVRPNNQGSPLVTGVIATPPAKKPTVHNVHLLDRSSSMRGGKYDNAVSGINEEIRMLKKDDTVNYTQTFIEFNYEGFGWNSERDLRLVRNYFLKPIAETRDYTLGAGADGGTPLYEALGTILEELLLKVPAGDKVLVKIFTDGEDLHSHGKYANKPTLAAFIKEVETKGYTITFVGTQFDTDNVITNLGITRSNTLTHNNTAEDVKRVFMVTSSATISYSKAVADGLDVKENFYSKSVQK